MKREEIIMCTYLYGLKLKWSYNKLYKYEDITLFTALMKQISMCLSISTTGQVQRVPSRLRFVHRWTHCRAEECLSGHCSQGLQGEHVQRVWHLVCAAFWELGSQATSVSKKTILDLILYWLGLICDCMECMTCGLQESNTAWEKNNCSTAGEWNRDHFFFWQKQHCVYIV